ncbi:MAG: LemA family protein [Bryobacteraceae bacterium]
MTVIAILASLGLIAGIAALLICDRLIRLLVRSETAWSNIEALLKVRHDMVPNLLETVKDYAAD